MVLKELFQSFTPYEWILSNKFGGYTYGNAFLANSRKYHGLLIAGKEDGERIHLVNGVEEKVSFSGFEFFLDTNFYKDIIYPEGYKLIKEFFYRPYPSFYFCYPQSKDFFLEKTIKMDKNKNTTLLSYKNISLHPFKLELRPKFTFRNHHTVQFERSWRQAKKEIKILKNGAFLSKNGISLFIFITQGKIFIEEIFYYQVYYPIEEIRGYEATEDLFSPFKIEVELNPNQIFYLIFSETFIENINKEIEIIEKYYKNYPQLNYTTKKFFNYNEYLKILESMIEDFLIKDNIIAGFPWFYCWGRDTFIGLPALFYLKNGKEITYNIFQKYKSYLKNGLIPNVIEKKGNVNYNSIDATLWFGLRIFQYIEFFKDIISNKEKKELIEIIKEIITQFLTNSLLPFRIDWEDGFIEIPENVNLALTWMDVIIDGIPLTPRYGKPIEISALWYNLLKFASKYFENSFLKDFKINSLIKKQKRGFLKYFNGELWADRIFKNEPIFKVRPNYIIALSLPFDIGDKTSLLKGLEIAKKELLTPYGLRSLSPRHPDFRKKYFGSQYMRDLAYHNGTVWVWLLYPYSEVLKKVYKGKKRILLEELDTLVKPFRERILSGKMGSIPELYDGENPYYPKGTHAQFWSVAAIFLIEKEIQKLQGGL